MICATAILIILVVVADAKSAEDVTRLLTDLFQAYNVNLRPSSDQNEPTQVDVVYTVKQLESLDIKSQVMNSLGYFSINWTDEFLKWDPEEYGGTEYITISEDKIWKPDYVVNNEIGGKKQVGNAGSLVAINSDGQVLWEPSFVSSTSCEVDITYFPFDTQSCSIHLTSWMTSNVSQQTFSLMGVQLYSYVENGEFEIVGTDVERTVYPMTYKDETLEGLIFILILKRRATFYWMCLVSPVIAFPFLSPLSFLVPADSGEKTTLAITALLSVFVFLGFVFDAMPKLSNAVSYFVLLASAQVFISLLTVVCNVIILCIHNLSPSRPTPGWMEALTSHRPSNEQLKASSDENDSCLTIDKGKHATPCKTTWRMLARELDKLCFIISLVSVSLVNVIFLVMFHSADA